MGVDLTLYPLEPYQAAMPKAIYPLTMLRLERWRWLWQQIEEQTTSVPLGGGVHCPFPDPGEGPFDPETEDPYGSPLTTVSAGELAAVTADPYPWDGNEAALAYLRALPADRRVVLWWH